MYHVAFICMFLNAILATELKLLPPLNKDYTLNPTTRLFEKFFTVMLLCESL